MGDLWESRGLGSRNIGCDVRPKIFLGSRLQNNGGGQSGRRPDGSEANESFVRGGGRRRHQVGPGGGKDGGRQMHSRSNDSDHKVPKEPTIEMPAAQFKQP
eukprot:4212298-Karenia_brevis.AAC.1